MDTVYETLRGEAVLLAHGSLVDTAATEELLLILDAVLRSSMVLACRATKEQTRQWWCAVLAGLALLLVLVPACRARSERQRR